MVPFLEFSDMLSGPSVIPLGASFDFQLGSEILAQSLTVCIADFDADGVGVLCFKIELFAGLENITDDFKVGVAIITLS